MDACGQSKAIRVAVRVRPLLPSDGATDHSLLKLDPERPNEVHLASGNDRRTARRYTFDQVFGPDVSQEALYDRSGMVDMVAAVAEGYHATVFAYGQTGSGKTFTMEGYRYVGASTHGPPIGPGKSLGVAISAGGRGCVLPPSASGNSPSRSGAPQADFAATPEQQLGLTPRSIRQLFASLSQDCDRRFQIRCSFVQIYREQVYDLLNPTSLAGVTGGVGGNRRPAGGSGGGLGAPLRMRWSQQEGFYLENMFLSDVENAEEAIAAFQAGVANKVMSSHRLNASSSRSHCIFTLHVASYPRASPLEQREAKLALVDLAGSERASHTGATEGALRDESVAINRSLFTLRQVIIALTAAAATVPSPQSTPAQPPHVPYRDSKLTCLLKHSLGGSSLTLMLACLSPADRFLEENASTLEYAARARRITNKIALNEDPRTRLIRELRQEVALLRQQLQIQSAAGGTDLPMQLQMLMPHAVAAAAKTVGQRAAVAATAAASADIKHMKRASATGSIRGGEGVDAGEGVAGGENVDEAALERQLRSSDVEVLVRAVIEASRVAVTSSGVLSGLRAAYTRMCTSLEALQIEYDNLAWEDACLRDRLSLLEALVAAEGRQPVGLLTEAATATGGGLYTASTAALIELEELRRENALLHERLQLLEPEVGPNGLVVMNATRRSEAVGGSRPGTSAAWSSASIGNSASARGGTGPAAARGTTVAGGGVRRQQSQRAQSAGALLPTGNSKSSAAKMMYGTAAAAAAAANPFIPSDVLMAVMSPPSPPPRTASGGGSGGGLRPHTSASSGNNGVAVGSGGASSSSSRSSKTLTVDQLRNVLQLQLSGGGGGGEGGSGAGPATAANVNSLDLHHDKSTDLGGVSGGHADGWRPQTSGGTGTSLATDRLSELGHAVASRAFTSGVRLSTTGKLLPAAPGRMVVEAAVSSGGGGSRPGTRSSASREPLASGTAAMVSPPLPPSPPAPEAALSALLAERNALTRQRLAGAGDH